MQYFPSNCLISLFDGLSEIDLTLFVCNCFRFMIKILQQEAAAYLNIRSNLMQAYQELQHTSQKVQFYIMLFSKNNNFDEAFDFIVTASNNNNLEVKPLLTAIWAYSLHLNQEDQRTKALFGLISQLHGRNFVEKSQILSQLPEWILQGAGIIDAQTFDKKIQRVYTKINYEQTKHFLIRQSNQGYSKLTLLLMGIRNSHDGAAIWKKILALVGNFDLDIDRVLDLIIEARLQLNQSGHFLGLLRNFKKESVVIAIGNKLKIDKVKSADGSSLSEKGTYCGPPEMFDGVSLEDLFRQIPFLPNNKITEMTAKCIKEDLFTYGELLPYLQPHDLSLKKISAKKSELMVTKINKSFTLSMVEIEDSQLVRIFNEQNLEFEGQLLHSSKLAVITAIARSNNWTDFTTIWTPFKYKFDLVLYQPLLHVLLDLLEWAVEPLMESGGFQKFFKCQKQQSSFTFEQNIKEFNKLEAVTDESLQRISQIMGYVGRYIGFRPRAFIKLCRLFKRIKKQYQDQQSIMVKVKQLTKMYLCPANGFAQANGPMAIELFSYLEIFDYQFRYECYLQVYKQAMTSSPYVARIFQSIKRKQNILVNNLSKENKKVFSRRIAKLMHNQALPVLYWIARRIVMEDYEAVVPEIVSVLVNSSPLTLDMTIFIMLFTLNQHKEGPVNIKTHQFQPWFKNITTFISNFFRKYLQADIQPVFDYIIMKTGLPFEELEEDDELPGSLLKLLHELLNKMVGSVMIQDVNKTKFDAIAAGPKLQAQILELNSEIKAAKKSKVMLQKFFWQQNKDHQAGRSLAFNLLVLLTQKRVEVFTKAFIDDLRILADIYDDFTLLIMQLVRVLFYQAQDYTHYALLLPAHPLSMLLKQYKVPLELTCEIVRPGVKHIASMNQGEWESLVTDFTQNYSQCLIDEDYLRKGFKKHLKLDSYLNGYKQKVLEVLPRQFFTSFWFLTIDSVYFPEKSYSQKIEDLKRKIDQYTSRRNQKDIQRAKLSYDRLTKEEEQQRKKYEETIDEKNLKKLEVDCLKGSDKEKREINLPLFAESFVQLCLIPRMMLDRAQALYCVKFTTQLIKANKMPATKSIRLITFIIEYVMNYLPFTTHRQASNCLSVFLSEILAIFINWSDPIKLKQDLKRILNIQESSGKDNYPKLRDYLIRLFERVGNIIKSVKQEPYIIKNCLYLLQKVDSIPGYKQQAEELMKHLNQLKQLYTGVDMRTILDRQIAILAAKKNQIADRPQEKKSQDKSKTPRPDESSVKKTPQEPSRSVPRDKSQDKLQKEVSKITQSKPPMPQAKSLTQSQPQVSHKGNEQNNNKANNDTVLPKPTQTVVTSNVAQSSNIRPQFNPLKGDRALQDRRSKFEQPRLADKVDEQKNKKIQSKFSDRPDNRFSDKSDSKFGDRPQERKSESRHRDQPKALISKDNVQKKDEKRVENQVNSSIPQQNKGGDSKPNEAALTIPPPKRLIDVKREQELKLQQGFSSQGGPAQAKDSSSKPKQLELKKQTVDSVSKDQKPVSSANVGPSRSQLITTEPPPSSVPNIDPNLTKEKSYKQSRKQSLKMSEEPKLQKDLENPNVQTIEPAKEQKKQTNKEVSKEVPKDSSREEKSQRMESRREGSQPEVRRDKWKDQGKGWQQNRPKAYYNQGRKGEERRQDRRERQRDRDKERQKKHDHYNSSRSHDKYARR